MTHIYLPPTEEFRRAVKSLIERHFEPRIADKFHLEYEANIYNMDMNKNIQAQVKDKNFVLEVRYQTGEFSSEYICDVCSWWKREHVEYMLLRYITDKARKGKIGKDWIEKNGKISSDITSGRFETKE